MAWSSRVTSRHGDSSVTNRESLAARELLAGRTAIQPVAAADAARAHSTRLSILPTALRGSSSITT